MKANERTALAKAQLKSLFLRKMVVLSRVYYVHTLESMNITRFERDNDDRIFVNPITLEVFTLLKPIWYENGIPCYLVCAQYNQSVEAIVSNSIRYKQLIAFLKRKDIEYDIKIKDSERYRFADKDNKNIEKLELKESILVDKKDESITVINDISELDDIKDNFPLSVNFEVRISKKCVALGLDTPSMMHKQRQTQILERFLIGIKNWRMEHWLILFFYTFFVAVIAILASLGISGVL